MRLDHLRETTRGTWRSARTIGGQFLLRVPEPLFHPGFDGSEADRASEISRNLRRHGVALLPGYFCGESLDPLCRAFQSLMSDTPPSEENPDAFLATDFLHADPHFLSAALDSLLLNAIGGYYRKRFFLGRADALRILPTQPENYGSFQWHHDTRGRQVKTMILLTDVDANGQCMRYLKGTHRRYYTHDRMYGPGSRFEHDLQEIDTLSDKVVPITGPAGTVALFDTNGLHRGTRNMSQTRDTVIFYYTTGRNVRTLHYRRDDVEALPATKRRVVTDNPAHVLV